MITKDTPMEQVLAEYPAAQRALYVKYHIGGCSGCGFSPKDTLAEVCAHNGDLPVAEVIDWLGKSPDLDRQLEVTPTEVRKALADGEEIRLLDVRTPEEWSETRIPEARLITEGLAEEMLDWPRDTPIVLHCRTGRRSLDSAAYLKGKGFSQVRSMQGGITAWPGDVDRTVRDASEADPVESGGEMAEEIPLEVSATEVSEFTQSGKDFKLLDVRTQEEWDMAHIEGATLLTEEKTKEVLEWPRDTRIVLHCHHGMRSLSAAEYFKQQGFTQVSSMAGGIDAWSVDVDTSVPRY